MATPHNRNLLDFSQGEKKPRAWITYRKKDGTGEHGGTIATNPEYVKVHSEWLWEVITLPLKKGKR